MICPLSIHHIQDSIPMVSIVDMLHILSMDMNCMDDTGMNLFFFPRGVRMGSITI